MARRLWPDTPDRAGFAALILASGGVFLLFGSTTMFDSMLTVATLLAMLALWSLGRGGRWPSVLLLGFALGFGVYAKGPVILVHVMPAAILMPLWADRAMRPDLRSYYLQIGMAVILALFLVALWLGPALILGGAEYRNDVLWRQTAGRVAKDFGHSRPIWFFLALLPLFFWPWGWGVAALKSLGPRKLWADMPSRLLAIWALSAFVAFSVISGKQAHYLLPELPALALLLSGMQVGDAAKLAQAAFAAGPCAWSWPPQWRWRQG